jgi:large subunit ribosomal protein L9
VKVLLNADVTHLGRQGEIVEVADGYARNYLLPRKLAQKATPGAVETATRRAAVREAAERKAVEAAGDLASVLAGTRVVIAAHAGDEGRLYGSVTVADVAEGIKKFTGVEVDRHHIKLDQPIRAIGLHEVVVRPHPEVEFPVTIDVIPA